MIDPKLVVRARDRWPESQKPVTMRGLWRLVLWASTAAVAMLVASLASRSEVGTQRAAAALAALQQPGFALLQSGTPAQAVPARAPGFDAEAETKRLASAVKELGTENAALKTRLAALEHGMDDVTGSIARQVDSAKSKAASAPWPSEAEPGAATPAEVAALVTPGLQPATQYGVDLGTAASIAPLRLRWTALRAVHARLFQGLTPTVALKDDGQPNRSDLQLVLGPLPDIDAASRLCAAVAAVRLPCVPTIFSPQHLTLE
jgi:hypothetical protein